ncbi:hypothetical protein JZO70_07475 [Enterococcus sp. 669A]|uniref:SD-repeat containing protein B domain-containing protein n=1 Tax=Candidatus Enterococcus moelleringii TaxID=2815325 RepID=A0ABS3L8Q8_9ENTE|nr:SdrD B-like domain-containing protein [Enterococcus sp. 669A]MBO1305995.1 hypothetical protein [Enterococcus sp. 669A]
MKNKRINTIIVLLFLLSLVLPTVFATRSLAEGLEGKFSLDSFEKISQVNEQLTAETKLTVQPSEEEQEIQLELSDNFLVVEADQSIINTSSNETLGAYSVDGQQVTLQLPALEEATQIALQLAGTYQNDGNDVTITQLETQEQLAFLPDQIPIVEEEPIETGSSEETSREVEETPDSVSPSARNTTLSMTAELYERDIVDGTESFDDDSSPGNDDDPNNQIVRSFDTITYPLKMTINDSAGGTLQNIKVRITGILHNGIVNGRTNAVFTDHSTNDTTNNTVTYEDEYTITSSSSAITYPIIVSVLGADHGVSLHPEFHVQVISVDGVDVTAENIEESFTDIAPRTVSSKVSIAPKISSGTIRYASETIITESAYDENHRTIPIGVELMAVPLAGKTDIKGAAFPSGDLKMKLSLNGRVVWDNAEGNPGPVQQLDFDGVDQAPFIVDYHNNTYGRGPNGISQNPNTWSNAASVEYRQAQFNDSRSYWAGSNIADRETYNGTNSVYSSGRYGIDGFDLKNDVEIDVSDYEIGDSFPTWRADGYTGRVVYTPQEKVFTNQTLGLLLPDDYAYEGRLNPDNRHNTLYYRATLTFVEEDGTEKTNTTEFSMRNEIPGLNGALSSIFKNPDTGLAFGKYDISNDIHPYGDGQAVNGAKVALSGGGGFGDSASNGGYQYLQKWNTDSFQMKADDFASNETMLKKIHIFGRISNNTPLNEGYWYGISKKSNPNTLKNLKNATIKDYDWFTGSQIQANHSYQQVGAVLIDKNIPVARSWKYNASEGKKGVQLTIVTDKLGSSTTAGTPNVYVAEMAVFRDSERHFFDPNDPAESYNDPNRYSITEGYSVYNETKYDEDNKLEELQSPVNRHTKFDTLGIVPVKVSNAIKSDKTGYYSTETTTWTIHDNGFIASQNYNDDDEIVWTVTLPPGLSYQYGTGKYGGIDLEPATVVTNPDSSQTLTWRVPVTSTPEQTAVLDDIQFETLFDDLNIDYVNNTTSLEVKSVISTEKDTSDEELRTATATINVTNIGRLSIYQTIAPAFGEVDDAYKVTITPYTSMNDEDKVRGIVPLDKGGSNLGSNFTGSNQLKAIDTELETDQTVRIYLNNSLIKERNPNAVNVGQNGWYPYTGSSQDLSDVQTVLYEFQETLSPNDTANIHLTMENDGNKYGDIYRHQAYGNSAANYREPVHSSIAQHSIKGRKLSGRVWLDDNEDGQLDASEQGIKDVPVTLYKEENGNYVKVTENLRGQSLTAVKTDEDGKYTFTYLPAGKYVVAFDSDSSPLEDMEVTQFNVGNAATSSKVDLDDQLTEIDGWNTILSTEFPELTAMPNPLFKQTNLNLGVYPKPVDPPTTSESESSTEDTTTPPTDTGTVPTTTPPDESSTLPTETSPSTAPPDTSETVPSTEPPKPSSDPEPSSEPPESSSEPEPSSVPPKPTEPTGDTSTDSTTKPSESDSEPSDTTGTTGTTTDSTTSGTSSTTNSTTTPPTGSTTSSSVSRPSSSGPGSSEPGSSAPGNGSNNAEPPGSDTNNQGQVVIPGNSNVPPGSRINLPSTTASNERRRTLLPRTNDTKQNLIFVLGIGVLVIAGRLWYKQRKID